MIEEIKSIIAQVMSIDINDILDEASPENTSNWDSIRHMELLTKLEQAYSVKFDIDEMIEMMSLQGIIEILKAKKNG
jgi:acyl carrier protein